MTQHIVFDMNNPVMLFMSSMQQMYERYYLAVFAQLWATNGILPGRNGRAAHFVLRPMIHMRAVSATYSGSRTYDVRPNWISQMMISWQTAISAKFPYSNSSKRNIQAITKLKYYCRMHGWKLFEQHLLFLIDFNVEQILVVLYRCLWKEEESNYSPSN